jgi:hypothetical protein
MAATANRRRQGVLLILSKYFVTENLNGDWISKIVDLNTIKIEK